MLYGMLPESKTDILNLLKIKKTGDNTNVNTESRTGTVHQQVKKHRSEKNIFFRAPGDFSAGQFPDCQQHGADRKGQNQKR